MFKRVLACMLIVCIQLISLTCGSFAYAEEESAIIEPITFEELTRGDRGDAVQALQNRLNELGYSVGTADGIFGGKTEDAIRGYQKDHGLLVTGVADIATQNLLYEIYKGNDEAAGEIHRYEFVIDNCSWHEASAKALEKGGYLAHINSQEELDEIVAEIMEQDFQAYRFRIGGQRDLDNLYYYWVDGENNPIGNPLNGDDEWSRNMWEEAEPRYDVDTADELYMELFFSYAETRWVWADTQDEVPSYLMGRVGYIIEYESEEHAEESEMHSYYIDSVVVNNNQFEVIVSTIDACRIRIDVLVEESEEILSSVEASLDEALDSQLVQLPEEDTLPEYFLLRVTLLDEEGNLLTNPYTCIQYTQDYAQFMDESIYDFPADRVLTYGEEETNNFAVLAEDVIIVDSTEDTNLFTTTEEGTYVFTNCDDTIRNLQPDDHVALFYGQDMNFLAVSTVSLEDDTVVVNTTDDYEISDVYQTIKLDQTIAFEPDDEAAEDAQAGEVSDLQFNVTGTNYTQSVGSSLGERWNHRLLQFNPDDIKSQLKQTIEIGPFSGGVSIGYKIHVKYYYDFVTFGKDYQYFEGSVDAEGKGELELKAEYDQSSGSTSEDDSNPLEKVLLDIKIPLVPCIEAYGKIGIPVTASISAKGTLKFEVSAKQEIRYSTADGITQNSSKAADASLAVEGEVEVGIGMKASLGVRDTMRIVDASIYAEAGVKAKGTVGNTLATTEEKVHACTLCVAVEPQAYAKLGGKLTFKWSKDSGAKLKQDVTPIDLTWKIADFYCSIINDKDSIFGGEPHVGIGECPNNKYRTTFLLAENPVAKHEDMVVAITRQPDGQQADTSYIGSSVYLYPREYVAELKGGERAEFEIEDSAKIVYLDWENARRLQIHGYVVDAKSKEPIEGADIACITGGKAYSVTSGYKGLFYITDVPPGNCQINASIVGYQPKTKIVDVLTDIWETTCTIELEPADLMTAEGYLLVGDLDGDGCYEDDWVSASYDAMTDAWWNKYASSTYNAWQSEPDFIYNEAEWVKRSASLPGFYQGGCSWSTMFHFEFASPVSSTLNGKEVSFASQQRVDALIRDEKADLNEGVYPIALVINGEEFAFSLDHRCPQLMRVTGYFQPNTLKERAPGAAFYWLPNGEEAEFVILRLEVAD